MIDPRIRGHEQKIVEYINDQVKTLRNARSEREQTWQECIKAYLSQFDDVWVQRAREEGRSARFFALTWDAVENVTSQLAAMLFPDEEWFKCEPGRAGGMRLDDDVGAEDATLLMKYQHREMKFRSEVMKLVKWLVVTGNCPWTMVWEEEQAVDYPSYSQAMAQWIQQQQVVFAQYQQQMTAYAIQARQASMQGLPPPPAPQLEMPERPLGDQSIAYAGPKLIVGDPFNFVIDSLSNDPRTAFRATTFWRSKAYLLSKSKPDETGYSVYENLDLIHNASRQSDEDADRERMVAELFGVEHAPKDQVKLVEAQGDFEIQFEDEPEYFGGYVATVANGKTLVRFEPTHLWSRDLTTQLATLIPAPGQTYGIGLVEMALGTQDSINVRVNQQHDAFAFAISPEMKAIDDGTFDPKSAESGPASIHLVGTLDNLQPIVRDLSGLQLSFNEIGQMKAELQQLTRSANPTATGHYQKSATEIARDTTVAGTSLQEIARYVEENALLPILRMQLQYDKQYLAEDVVLRIVQDGNAQWRQVSPQSIRSNWDIVVVGSQSSVLKEQQVRDLMMFFQLVTGNPLTAQLVDARYLMSVLYRKLGFNDGDHVFLSEQQLLMQQQMQLAQQAMGGGPGGADTGQGGAAPGNEDPQGNPGDGVPPGTSPVVEATAPGKRQADWGRMGAGTGMV